MSESRAVLTLGWGEVPEAVPAERAEQALQSPPSDRPLAIDVNPLFRRRPGGAKPLQNLIASISAQPSGQKVYLLIDVFAYAYLSAAKNLDWLLPEAPPKASGIGPEHLWRTKAASFHQRIEELKRFEQTGLPPEKTSDAEHYLQLRETLVRVSAREERRVLLHLLINGPATTEQAAEDLGMHPGLAERVIRALSTGPSPSLHAIAAADGQRSAIRLEALPAVTLGLHLRSGLNLLDHLPDPASESEVPAHG